MARQNEYDETGRIILRDTEGTIISFYRFMQLSLGPDSHPWAPPYWWGGYSGHQGYDLGAPAYSEVRSLCTGKVVVVYGVNDGDRSMGNSVCIEETGQPTGAVVRTHRYMHFVQYPSVSLGDIVEQGTLLGYVGTTGQSSGNHLHYDVTKNGPWGPKLDGWDQYNHSSEPTDWTPQEITNASGSAWGTNLSWSVIGETTGINYGPGKAGGSEPAYTPKTFTTNKPVLSVDWGNISNRNYIDPNEVGGLLIQVGTLSTSSNTIEHLSAFKQWVSMFKGVIPMGFYLYSYISPTLSRQEMKDKMQIYLDALDREGILPTLADLGVWLKLGDDSPTSSTAALNLNIVKAFRELFAGRGYATTGLCCSVDFIQNHLNVADLADIPIWLRAWVTDGESSYSQNKADLPNYVPSALYSQIQSQIYIWQDGTQSYPSSFIAHNWVIKPIPGVGYNETEADAGYVGGGMPELVPAAIITFKPEPGRILTSSTELEVTVNAENVSLNYTIDNTIPQFIVQGASVLAMQAYKRLPQTYPGRNLFIRVYAFDATTRKVVAKGAACYAWVWTRPQNHREQPILIEDVTQPYLDADELRSDT